MPRSLFLSAPLLLALLTAPAAAQWAQLNGPLPPSVGGIARAGGVMVLGTGQADAGDVYRSTDGGQTWANALLPNGGVLAAHAAGAAFFVGTYLSGAHRSDDGGLTWIPLEDLGSSIGSFAGAGSRLFAGGDGFLASVGVFRSTDGGVNWTEVLPGLQSRALHAEGLLALAGGQGAAGLYRSTDGGTTWAAVPAFAGSAWTVGALTAQGTTLYAGVRHDTDTAQRGVYRSTDGGQTWAKVSTNLPPLLVRSLVVRGTTMLAIAAPSGFGFGKLYRSTDGGVTWTEVPLLPSGEDLLTLFDDGATFWLGSSLGAFRSTGGLTWSRSDTGTAAISGAAALLADGDALFVGLTNNGGGGLGLWRTDDLGQTWTLLDDGLSDRAAIQALHREGTTLFAGDYGAFPRGVYRSEDDGASWTFSSAGISTSAIIYDLHGHDGVLLVGAWEALYRSTDGGFTWATVPSMSQVRTLATYAGALWAGGGDGYVHRSADGGLTWIRVGARLSANGVETLVVSGGALYAATWGGGIYRLDLLTAYAGPVPGWTPTSLPATFVGALADVRGVLVAAAPLEGVFVSADGGGTWLPFEEGYAGGEVYEFAATPSHLVAGTRGHALWAHPLRRPVAEAAASAQVAGRPGSPGAPAIFPNPAPVGRPVTLALEREQPGPVSVSVYDALGRRVGVAAYDLAAGVHRLALDLPGLAPGLYLVRVVAGEEVTTARLTVRP
jgi:photosystem II stability/assembly factor-like uncharacterized protein